MPTYYTIDAFLRKTNVGASPQKVAPPTAARSEAETLRLFLKEDEKVNNKYRPRRMTNAEKPARYRELGGEEEESRIPLSKQESPCTTILRSSAQTSKRKKNSGRGKGKGAVENRDGFARAGIAGRYGLLYTAALASPYLQPFRRPIQPGKPPLHPRPPPPPHAAVPTATTRKVAFSVLAAPLAPSSSLYRKPQKPPVGGIRRGKAKEKAAEEEEEELEWKKREPKPYTWVKKTLLSSSGTAPPSPTQGTANLEEDKKDSVEHERSQGRWGGRRGRAERTNADGAFVLPTSPEGPPYEAESHKPNSSTENKKDSEEEEVRGERREGRGRRRWSYKVGSRAKGENVERGGSTCRNTPYCQLREGKTLCAMGEVVEGKEEDGGGGRNRFFKETRHMQEEALVAAAGDPSVPPSKLATHSPAHPYSFRPDYYPSYPSSESTRNHLSPRRPSRSHYTRYKEEGGEEDRRKINKNNTVKKEKREQEVGGRENSTFITRQTSSRSNRVDHDYPPSSPSVCLSSFSASSSSSLYSRESSFPAPPRPPSFWPSSYASAAARSTSETASSIQRRRRKVESSPDSRSSSSAPHHQRQQLHQTHSHHPSNPHLASSFTTTSASSSALLAYWKERNPQESQKKKEREETSQPDSASTFTVEVSTSSSLGPNSRTAKSGGWMEHGRKKAVSTSHFLNFTARSYLRKGEKMIVHPELVGWLSLAGITIPVAYEKGTAYRRYLAQPFTRSHRLAWEQACKNSQIALANLLPGMQKYAVEWGNMMMPDGRPLLSRNPHRPQHRRHRHHHGPCSRASCYPHGEAMMGDSSIAGDGRRRRWASENEGCSNRSSSSDEDGGGCAAYLSGITGNRNRQNRNKKIQRRGGGARVPPSLRVKESQTYEKACAKQLHSLLQESSHWRRVWGDTSIATVGSMVDGRYLIPSKLSVEQDRIDLKLFRRRGWMLREVVLKYIGLDHIGNPAMEEDAESSVNLPLDNGKEDKDEEGEKNEEEKELCLQKSNANALENRDWEKMEKAAGIQMNKNDKCFSCTEGLRPIADHSSQEVNFSSFSSPDGSWSFNDLQNQREASQLENGVDGSNSSLVVVGASTASAPIQSRDILLDVKLDPCTGVLRLRLQLLLTIDQEVPVEHVKDKLDSAPHHDDGMSDKSTRTSEEGRTVESNEPPSCSQNSSLSTIPKGKTRMERSESHCTRDGGGWRASSYSAGNVTTTTAYGTPFSYSFSRKTPNAKILDKKMACMMVEKRTQKRVLLGTWKAVTLGPSMRWLILHGPLQHKILYFDLHPCRRGLSVEGSPCDIMMRTKVNKHLLNHSALLPSGDSERENSPHIASMVFIGSEGVGFHRLHPCDRQASHVMCSRCGQCLAVLKGRSSSPFNIYPQLVSSFSPVRRDMHYLLGQDSSRSGQPQHLHRGGEKFPSPVFTPRDLRGNRQCASCRCSTSFIPVSSSFPQAVHEYLRRVRQREAKYQKLRPFSLAPAAPSRGYGGSDPRTAPGFHRRYDGVKNSALSKKAQSVEKVSSNVFSLFEDVLKNRQFPCGIAVNNEENENEGGKGGGAKLPKRKSRKDGEDIQDPLSCQWKKTKDELKTRSMNLEVVSSSLPSKGLYKYGNGVSDITRAKMIRAEVKDLVNQYRVELGWHPLWGRTFTRRQW